MRPVCFDYQCGCVCLYNHTLKANESFTFMQHTSLKVPEPIKFKCPPHSLELSCISDKDHMNKQKASNMFCLFLCSIIPFFLTALLLEGRKEGIISSMHIWKYKHVFVVDIHCYHCDLTMMLYGVAVIH